MLSGEGGEGAVGADHGAGADGLLRRAGGGTARAVADDGGAVRVALHALEGPGAADRAPVAIALGPCHELPGAEVGRSPGAHPAASAATSSRTGNAGRARRPIDGERIRSS